MDGQQNGIESVNTEQAFAMKEVGDMGLAKAGLPGEQGAGKSSSLDTAR